MNTKENLCSIIDKNERKIIALGKKLFANPELGFKEFKTSAIAGEYLSSLGINVVDGLSLTGFKAQLGDSSKGVNLCLIAELDAVPCSDNIIHHACGHSSQIAIMCAVMEALYESGILAQLAGSVTLIATPAEEFVDYAYRETLVKQGKIKYMSGKQDMIAEGLFDDMDLIISCHAMGSPEDLKAEVNCALNGFVKKTVTYLGKAAHAGAQPHLGINALNAAIIGLSAVNTQRETFQDEHNIRVHGIITNGGETINTVPAKTVVEAFVRGSTLESIWDAQMKVDRAFEAGAYAVGAKCIIETTPGYMPFLQCGDLSSVLKENLRLLLEDAEIADGNKSFASGDVGDLSMLKPVIQFGFAGFSGRIHSSDFAVCNNYLSYVMPAKAVLMTIIDLLDNGGETAKKIIDDNPPKLSKAEYISKWLNNGAL